MTETMSLPLTVPAAALACGAYLKNRACRIDGRELHWSALHGDLGAAEARIALEDSVEQLCAQPGPAIAAVAHDLHPDFPSTALAQATGQRLGRPVFAVQHHHAHIAAVVAEHGLRDPVIGIALDGVGLGTDGQAWGGELLWVGGGLAAHRWQRLAHLAPLLLPGGDVAAREPWRMAAAALHALGKSDQIVPRFGPVVGEEAARLVGTMLNRQLNSPPTTSAGRWFDAAAGALGLSVRQAREAEAAIALETQARRWLDAHPDFDVDHTSLDLRSVIGALFDVDPTDAQAVARGAATFHLALAGGLAQAAIEAAHAQGCSDVALGGGCFMNRVLSNRLASKLEAAGLRVHAPRAVDCGDAGLALGQAWVAACAVADGGEPVDLGESQLAGVH